MERAQYIFDEKKFKDQFIMGGKLNHKITKSSAQVFPFSATTKKIVIDHETFKCIVGCYFLAAEGLKCSKSVDKDEMVECLVHSDSLEIDEEDIEVFKTILSDRFFTQDGRLKSESLLALELGKADQDNVQSATNNSIEKNAEYLLSVLGDDSRVKKMVLDAKNQEINEYDALQSFFFSHLSEQKVTKPISTPDHFLKVFYGFDEVYDEDLAYLLVRKQRFNSNDLENLMRLYYFAYVSQTIEVLSQFLKGKPDKITPLYFILSWEKTSKSRLAITNGWEQLKSRFYTLFSQQITLVILNQIQDVTVTTPEGQKKNVVFDYITLNQFIEKGLFNPVQVAEQIHKMADYYRSYISDADRMTAQKRNYYGIGSVSQEIDYLYNSVKMQFQETRRSRISNSYYREFESITRKFQQNKGRLGKVLALDEDFLLFLTRIAIKDQDKIRLNDLFRQFERRGIFLDNLSKKEAAGFFERLNLIEKKSDSGDAMYVRNIQ